MRLEEYLFESNNKDNEIYWTNKNDIGKIHANCSEIIKIYKKTNKFFYRGIEKWLDQDKMIRKKPRLRRQPKDMPDVMHKLLDKYFYEKFGWKPRSQGVFVTPLFNVAREYGDTSIFFPFDGFEYIWSQKIDDAYNAVGSPGDYYGGTSDYIFQYGPSEGNGHWKKGSKIVKKIEDFKDFVGYDPEFDEYNAVDLNHMIYTVEFTDGDDLESDSRYEKWEWIPNVTYDEFLNKLILKRLSSYKNTGLVQSLTKENEVMFKCDYYYAIPADIDISPRYFGI